MTIDPEQLFSSSKLKKISGKINPADLTKYEVVLIEGQVIDPRLVDPNVLAKYIEKD